MVPIGPSQVQNVLVADGHDMGMVMLAGGAEGSGATACVTGGSRAGAVPEDDAVGAVKDTLLGAGA